MSPPPCLQRGDIILCTYCTIYKEHYQNDNNGLNMNNLYTCQFHQFFCASIQLHGRARNALLTGTGSSSFFASNIAIIITAA